MWDSVIWCNLDRRRTDANIVCAMTRNRMCVCVCTQYSAGSDNICVPINTIIWKMALSCHVRWHSSGIVRQANMIDDFIRVRRRSAYGNGSWAN